MATVLVTGGNRGIGLEFVTQYLERSDTVIAACRNIQDAKLRALSQAHPGLQLIELDVADAKSRAEFVSRLGDQAIDILINNAGVYGPKNVQFGNVEEQDWSEVFRINTIAPLLLTQELMQNLKKGKDRKLIFITSKMGSIADNQGGSSYIYRSSKTALNQVVKSLAIDLTKEGFSAVVLHPGWVLTDMGGPNAMIDTTTSVGGMIKVIDKLTLSGSGRFYNYDGADIPW